MSFPFPPNPSSSSSPYPSYPSYTEQAASSSSSSFPPPSPYPDEYSNPNGNGNVNYAPYDPSSSSSLSSSSPNNINNNPISSSPSSYDSNYQYYGNGNTNGNGVGTSYSPPSLAPAPSSSTVPSPYPHLYPNSNSNANSLPPPPSNPNLNPYGEFPAFYGDDTAQMYNTNVNAYSNVQSNPNPNNPYPQSLYPSSSLQSPPPPHGPMMNSNVHGNVSGNVDSSSSCSVLTVPPSFNPSWVIPCHPKYLSLSCLAFPQSNSLRLRSSIPFGGIVRPMADVPNDVGLESIPLVELSPSHGVIRCRDCRSYINPFVQWSDNGSRWVCNFCGLHNDVPQSYFSPIDASSGRRVDFASRPELQFASVEISAPADYMVRPPMPPTFLFIIDVSINATKSGAIKSICSTISSCLDSLPGGVRTMIGFITFDSTVHFYQFKGNSLPQMFVVSDLTDIFLPVPDSLLVNLSEHRSLIHSFLLSLPNIHSKTKDVETALGSALEGALQVTSRIGGKFLIFISSLPSLDPGRLTNRENPKILGSPQEHSLLVPSMDFYRKQSLTFSKYQICCDLFFLSDLYCDIATLSEMSKLTGGQTYFFPQFNSNLHQQKLHKELSRCLGRPQGWEAVVRVRASKGVIVSDFHGNFNLRGNDLLALPGIDGDKTFVFELKNDESLIRTPTICVQSALLYTTSEGERRIRVHTISVPVTSILTEIFERVNANCIINCLTKISIQILLKDGMEKAREHIKNKCLTILRTHRATMATAMGMGMAKNVNNEMSLIPLLTLGILKNLGFKEGNDVRSDVRSYILSQMYTMGTVELETFIRPRMLPLQTLTDRSNIGMMMEEKENSPCYLPPESSLTSEVLTPTSVYLVDNSMEFIMRIGKQVSAQWLLSVFGVSSLEGIDTKHLQLRNPTSADDANSPLRKIINIFSYLRSISPHYQHLFLVKEGDAQEIRFLNLLIEDRMGTQYSLNEFDQIITRQTQQQQQHPQQNNLY